MRMPRRKRQWGLAFNLTPMIDIVFNLVIFFLVATHFVSTEPREALALPEASQTDARPPAPRRLIINVLADGSLRVKGQPVELDDVSRMIAEDTAAGLDDYEVQIRSDRSVPYAEVEPLLLACARHGVTRVTFAKLDR